ncbi:uncharacterized protein [Palaemon carinicauda]|uniref:uncharacterized protein n=1 Tax=Palaemon carinicauda TaxID=392227 RepID=UPI0035B58042
MEVKLLGLKWNRELDTLSTFPIVLEASASTKRSILGSIASNFDSYNINGPVFNGAGLFMHGLQCDKSLGWDDILPAEKLKEWKCIARQASSTPEFIVQRFVGERDGRCRLLACVDDSSAMCGAVLYVESIDAGRANFLLAKDRLINRHSNTGSVPSLELRAICLGVELLVDLCEELGGPGCLVLIAVVGLNLCSDGLVALSWINSYIYKLDEMQKGSVFVLSRLQQTDKLCKTFPVDFAFITGAANSGGCIAGTLSYKQLINANYFSGPQPDIHRSMISQDIVRVAVASPAAALDFGEESVVDGVCAQDLGEGDAEHLVSLNRYSSFSLLVGVHDRVAQCFAKWRAIVAAGELGSPIESSDAGFCVRALKMIILREQKVHFPSVLECFTSNSKFLKDVPSLVRQLSGCPDKDGVLGVGGRFDRWKGKQGCCFPILLFSGGSLTELIIGSLHIELKRAGCYSVLNQLRKRFWLSQCFSTVGGVVKDCVICERCGERAIRLNQCPSQEFGMDPSQIPFSCVYIDYFGPYFVKLQTTHLINRRPIAFKDGLRDVPDEYVPSPITPEKLIHGYELTSVKLIPELQCDPELDGEYDLKDSP